MNFSSTIGFGLAVAIIWFGVIRSSANPQMFLDSHALLIVGGGTVAAALIAFPIRRIVNLIEMLLFGVIFKRKFNNGLLIAEILSAATRVQMDPSTLRTATTSHPFLREAFHLIVEGILTEEQLAEVLHRRSEFFRRRYSADAKMLSSLAKFPPAFGLLGASTGMITMMTRLGSGGQEIIGPAMAIALVATFWGIALANFVLLPLSDYANRLAADDSGTRQIIVDGALMILRREPLAVMAAKLNGYLPLQARYQLRRRRRPSDDEMDSFRRRA